VPPPREDGQRRGMYIVPGVSLPFHARRGRAGHGVLLRRPLAGLGEGTSAVPPARAQLAARLVGAEEFPWAAPVANPAMAWELKINRNVGLRWFDGLCPAAPLHAASPHTLPWSHGMVYDWSVQCCAIRLRAPVTEMVGVGTWQENGRTRTTMGRASGGENLQRTIKWKAEPVLQENIKACAMPRAISRTPQTRPETRKRVQGSAGTPRSAADDAVSVTPQKKATVRTLLAH